MHLTEHDRNRIAARVAGVEAKTGARVVTTVVDKSDSYPEAPWKAFALGTTLGALFATACSLATYDWEPGESALYLAAFILGCGALLALATVLLTPLARLFTGRLRRDTEVIQYAQSLFFTRGLGRTRGRLGVLLLVSLFERKVVLLADEGFDGHIAEGDWRQIADRMTLLLSHDKLTSALHAGLEALEAVLLEHGFRADRPGEDELSNAVVEMRGER